MQSPAYNLPKLQVSYRHFPVNVKHRNLWLTQFLLESFIQAKHQGTA